MKPYRLAWLLFLLFIAGILLVGYVHAARYGDDINRALPWSEQACYRIATEVEFARVVRESDGKKTQYFEKFILKLVTDGEAIREISDAWDKEWTGIQFIDDCLERLQEYAKRERGGS